MFVAVCLSIIVLLIGFVVSLRAVFDDTMGESDKVLWFICVWFVSGTIAVLIVLIGSAL